MVSVDVMGAGMDMLSDVVVLIMTEVIVDVMGGGMIVVMEMAKMLEKMVDVMAGSVDTLMETCMDVSVAVTIAVTGGGINVVRLTAVVVKVANSVLDAVWITVLSETCMAMMVFSMVTGTPAEIETLVDIEVKAVLSVEMLVVTSPGAVVVTTATIFEVMVLAGIVDIDNTLDVTVLASSVAVVG